MSDPEKETKTAPASVKTQEAQTVIRTSSTFPGEANSWGSPSVVAEGALPVPAPGQTLAGRYMVFEQIGQGGMGVVLAAYDTRLDRRIALKLLRPHASAEATAHDGEARMVREAQAMARLNHPHVVAVYDAGALEDGTLFIAMEYVEGQTLRGWREEAARSWREVLKAYLAAGRGLAAAHVAGLIHRDFKPDNVLVGKDGRVRVMDFGLARARTGPTNLEDSSSSLSSESLSNALTDPGTLMGTPKYMAPELMRGATADVRSDLYAFCVSLYEALYGHLPFPDERMSEYSRARREGRITPPPASSEVPAWVARTVLQGLQVDPLQRPASMEALLTALEDDPAVKRQGRRRALAIGAVVLLLAELGFWGWMHQHAQEPICSRVERRMDGIWDPAVKAHVQEAMLGTAVPYAQDTAARVATVLDGYAGRWLRQGRELCEAEQTGQVPRLAALRESCLERRLSRLRATTELMARGSDPELLEKAVQAVHSLPPLEDCVDDKALTAAVPPPEDPVVRAQVEALLEQVDRAEALLGAGKYKEGLSAAEALLKRVEKVEHAPLHAQVLFLVARLKDGLGDYDSAEQLTRQSLSAAAQGKDLRQMSRAMSFLLLLVGPRQKRYGEALPLIPVVQAVAESTGDELTEAVAFSNLGLLLMNEGKYQHAWENHSRALALRQKVLGAEHPDVATSISSLAMAAWWMGRYDEAVEMAERALVLKEKALGPEHPEIIRMLSNSGGTLYEVGRYEDALQRYDRALRLQEKVLGPDNPSVAPTLINLSIGLLTLGRYEEALEKSERALALTQKARGRDSVELSGPLASLGLALSELGRHKEALAKHERALALRQKALGSEHALVAESLRYQGIELMHLKRYNEARERLDRSLAIHAKALGDDHPDLAYPLEALGELLLAEGKPAEALPVLERARKITPKGFIRAELQLTLARALWDARRSERQSAVALATEARDYWQHIGQATRLTRTTQWLASHPLP